MMSLAGGGVIASRLLRGGVAVLGGGASLFVSFLFFLFFVFVFVFVLVSRVGEEGHLLLLRE